MCKKKKKKLCCPHMLQHNQSQQQQREPTTCVQNESPPWFMKRCELSSNTARLRKQIQVKNEENSTASFKDASFVGNEKPRLC